MKPRQTARRKRSTGRAHQAGQDVGTLNWSFSLPLFTIFLADEQFGKFLRCGPKCLVPAVGDIGTRRDFASVAHGADIEAHKRSLLQVQLNEPMREPPQPAPPGSDGVWCPVN